MNNPLLSTFSLSQVPAANITVLLRSAVPFTDPIIVLDIPVVTAHPAFVPKNRLLLPAVVQRPAHAPISVLSVPVVIDCPLLPPFV